jgi:hypothetical protein
MRHHLERSQENLTLSKSGTIVTVGVCGLCSVQFKSYLPNPDKAMWEVKVLRALLYGRWHSGEASGLKSTPSLIP